MSNYHFRNMYECQCEYLGAMVGNTYHPGVITNFTDAALLRQINSHLRKLDCILFTEEEINTIVLQ